MSLFKKGTRNDRNNYRRICLLAIGIRVLEKVKPEIKEIMNLTDENQSGISAGTADTTQVMLRLTKDAEFLRKRRKRRGDEEKSGSDQLARLLDL